MSRPITPVAAGPTQNLSRSNSQRPISYLGGEVTGIEAHDQYSAAPRDGSILAGSAGAHDSGFGSSTTPGLQRSGSQLSQSATAIPSRGGTLKKKASLKRTGSLNRSGSKKSSYAGSVRSIRLGDKEKYDSDAEHNSAFYCPVPISGSPTDLLADRFQAWRRVLKDIINYFRDIQKSYETRAKTLHSASNTINNIQNPGNFLRSGGIADALSILQEFHKLSLNESNKSRELENEVILQLTGLRSDLQQKIKEIKSLSGDFKNSVGKEQEGTKKAVRALQDSLGHVDHDAASTSGKGDPFLVKLGVDRQLERQIEEENYLHRAYLNLEASGRELESIVIGEIQKAYNVLAGIMKREADHSYETAEKLREGPVAMPKDHEWDAFVTGNDHMVDPRLPLRSLNQITYPGKDHPAAIDVRSGMLERKSKYLKNYTPGWYVLSPTHLHEFKSADKISFQAPIMSLYLPEQKLGTHSEPGSNSHKFMLKGRQTGTMHRGHSWIFRAETHDTMLAWYHDIKQLTEMRGEERNEFVRRTHARTLSSGSMKAPSIGSGSGMEDDEADRAPFSAEESIRGPSIAQEVGVGAAAGAAAGAAGGYMMDDQRSEPGWRPQRPTPGGRFPSDINVQRGLQAPLSPSSGDSIDESDRDAIAAAGALPGSGIPFVAGASTQPHTDLQQPATYQPTNEMARAAPSAAPMTEPAGISDYTAGDHRRVAPTSEGAVPVETASTYGEWMAPIAAGAAGATAYHHHHDQKQPENVDDQQDAIPAPGHSSAPIMEDTAPPADAPIAPRAMLEDTTPGYSSAPIMEDTAPPVNAPIAPRAMLSAGATMPVEELNSGVGVVAPAPSQVLAAAGVHSSYANAPAPITTSDSPTPAAGIDAAGHQRPEMPHSAKSVMTISDLHVPGEYPKVNN